MARTKLTAVRLTVCCSHNLPQSLIREHCIPLTNTVKIGFLDNNFHSIILYSYTKHIHIQSEKVFQIFQVVGHIMLLYQYIRSYYSEIYYF